MNKTIILFFFSFSLVSGLILIFLSGILSMTKSSTIIMAITGCGLIVLGVIFFIFMMFLYGDSEEDNVEVVEEGFFVNDLNDLNHINDIHIENSINKLYQDV